MGEASTGGAERCYVGGQWVAAASGATREVVCAVTEEPFAAVADGGAADVDAAVAAAAGAFEAWAATPPLKRAAHVAALGTRLTERMDEIGALVAREVGTPIGAATLIQVGLPAWVAATTAEVAAAYPFAETVGSSLVLREPAGVAACLTPWNYPLHQAMCKVAAALVAGCTVVLKPSEVAPLSALALARAAEAVGLPAGVLNVVTGGPAAGEALVAHPGVDVVSFTGSTPVGRRVAGVAAGALKRLSLELSGKSAAVVLDDADLGEAVASVVRQAMLNGGQTCIAWTRLLVPRALHDEAADRAAEVASALVVGDPRDPATEVGPLATAAQRDRVRARIVAGEAEGARRVCGGTAPPPGLDRGFYVAPTVFAGVDNRTHLAREEIFGPVLAVIPHDGDDHAAAVANDSPYGLHGAVFSGDRARAEAVARRLRTGRVDIGNAAFNPYAPFGGFKQSGTGRELGRFGIDAFVELKSVQRP